VSSRAFLCFLLAASACSSSDENSDASVPTDAASNLDAASDAGVLADAAVFADAETFPDAAPFDSGVPIDPLAGIGPAELIEDGFMFIEGPTWRAAEGVLLFTDIDDNRIVRFTPPDTFDTFRMPSDRANGLASDTTGLLIACEHETRRVTRTLSDGTVMSIADTFEGELLNSPNDLTIRSDNTIYFTDPPFGLGNRMRGVPFNGVFRIDPRGVLTAEWRGSLSSRPNGIALSPDENTLYLADSASTQVRAFDVAEDGSLSNERPFVTTAAVEDGMAVDDGGNLYVTTMAGVEVFAPDGTKWGTILVAEQPANVAFGGADRRTLYITARSGLYKIDLPISGGN
jgi:gluconolactonase